MNRAGTNVAVRDTDHWHDLRSRNIGCSELPTLFGEHPQLTHFELWHIKNGTLPAPDLSDNDRVFWGQIIEPAIAEGVAKKTGWTVRKVHRYIQHPTIEGFGGSLDYEIVSHARGPGVLEIKNVDWLVAKGWEDGEPGLHHMLQLQGQLAITGRSWGALGVLIGGNNLKVFEYERRPKTIAKIEEAIAEFWQSIAEGREPKPNFTTDADTLAKIHGSATEGKVIDLSESNRAPYLCAEYLTGAAMEKAGEAKKDAAKAELLTLIGDAAVGRVLPFKISAGEVAATPDRVITADMVGQTIRGRRGYRNFCITEKKEASK